MGLQWTSIGGVDEDSRIAATVIFYGAPGPHWIAFVLQEALVDQHGHSIRFANEAEAQAAADEAWLERRIADLDASVADG